jgi:hypothetical protein
MCESLHFELKTLYNGTEGLSMTFTSTSSLVKVAEYQNASIYLDLSSNSAFSGYKVGIHFLQPSCTLDIRLLSTDFDSPVQSELEQLSC